MGSIIGFSLFKDFEEKRVKRLLASQTKAISIVDGLNVMSFTHGTAQLYIWGHGELSERFHKMRDGSLLALIGSPINKVNWFNVEEEILADKFVLPWDGRVILLQISADGKRWTMWNDWLGSIPVFHAEIKYGRIASTLEPVTVSAAGYTPDDFFMPGLMSLLINGHPISDWTLYKGMKVIPPDSVVEWDEKGVRTKKLWTVQPSQNKWEASWDDLVDEMHELSYRAIADTLKTQSTWILPLSSGLDSRLIAAVAADEGTDAHAYAWGGPNTTDVICSQQIAGVLGFPWQRIDLRGDFLVKYTSHWADMFGSALHFHGMYQMAFLENIEAKPGDGILSGFIGEVLAGDGIGDLEPVHLLPESYQLCTDWYTNWKVDEIRSAFKIPVEDALQFNALEYKKLIGMLQGAFFQKMMFLELWNRQRLFISFQAALADHWRSAATPFLNRDYARFCFSLPRAALDSRRLLKDVFRRYYGRLAVIPGTYAYEPLILTGRYLFNRRVAKRLPNVFKRGPFAGFENVQLRMDVESIQASGRDALWPLFENKDLLSQWLDVDHLERDYQTLMRSKEDILPLRRLQSAQVLAYRLQ